jgi:hypothetical protein
MGGGEAMGLTVEEVHEAGELIRAHNELRTLIAKTEFDGLGLYAHDSEHRGQPRLPVGISVAVKEVALALVAARLRFLGVVPKTSLTHECFECNGSGEVPIERGGS